MKVKRSNSGSAESRFRVSVNWLPAFLAGLSIGILIHFLPGMKEVLEEARRPESLNVVQAPSATPKKAGASLWQPPPTAQRRPGR